MRRGLERLLVEEGGGECEALLPLGGVAHAGAGGTLAVDLPGIDGSDDAAPSSACGTTRSTRPIFSAVRMSTIRPV
ncbi:MAG: hypothetical protein IPK72_17885 [Candidatus Eisenbacteria bacterium]|nr:hypothetical protein [Candidatus Eisenbacteria bacterium]